MTQIPNGPEHWMREKEASDATRRDSQELKRGREGETPQRDSRTRHAHFDTLALFLWPSPGAPRPRLPRPLLDE